MSVDWLPVREAAVVLNIPEMGLADRSVPERAVYNLAAAV